MTSKVMVDPRDLQKGMYVAELDRPWLDSPFLFQGFRITNNDELDQLAQVCDYVFVDVEKSQTPVSKKLSVVPLRSEAPRQNVARFIKTAPVYQATFEEEYPRAKQIYHQAYDNVITLFSDIRVGKSFEAAEVKYTVTSLVDSIMRHPDALMLLSSLQQKGNNMAIAHAVNVCTLSITFGRYLGFDKQQLTELGMGAMLHDIGESKLPEEIILHAENGTPAQLKQFQDHTTFGAAMIHKAKGLPECAVAIARDHHERANGSGYPQKLIANQVDIYTMLVAIVDVYDNVTSGLYGKPTIACTEALKNIYVWREELFDSLLVEKFIQCLGIYPIGSVVELKSGEIGIVVSTSPDARLFPTVMLVRNERLRPIDPPRVINLANFKTSDQRQRYEIKSVLKPGQHDVDVRNYMLRELQV